MLKNLDGVKRIKKKLPAADTTAAEGVAEKDESPASGVKKFSGAFFRLLDVQTHAETRAARRERRQAERLGRREEKMQREQERLKRIAAERDARTQALWQSAAAAKKYEEERGKKKGRLKKARAKLKAERLALKLQKQSGEVSDSIPQVSLWKKLGRVTGQKSQAVSHYFFGWLSTVARHGLRYVGFLLLCGAFVVGILALLVYATPPQNSIRQVLIYNLPFPALVVDYHPVSYPDYLAENRLLGDYYLVQANVDDATRQNAESMAVLRTNLVRRHLIEKSIFWQLQRRYHVTVTSDEANSAFSRIAAANGGEEKFTESLYNSFGLTKDFFIANIAYYDALKIKLAAAFVTDDAVNQSALLRIQNVAKLLSKDVQSFEELAERFSEDEHAMQGGDFGYVKTAAMSNELRAAVEKLDAGMTSSILQEAGRYYIVKVYDRKQPKTGEEVWLKQISIFTNYTFTDYLTDLEKNARVWDWTK
jgi:hypothetical protein